MLFIRILLIGFIVISMSLNLLLYLSNQSLANAVYNQQIQYQFQWYMDRAKAFYQLVLHRETMPYSTSTSPYGYTFEADIPKEHTDAFLQWMDADAPTIWLTEYQLSRPQGYDKSEPFKGVVRIGKNDKGEMTVLSEYVKEGLEDIGR